MITTTRDVVLQLAEGFPELRPLLGEHVEDNYGELLPHVFFGVVTDWLVESYLASPDAPATTWQRALDQLERIYESGNDDVRELLYVSFLEILPYPDEPGGGIAEHLGPRLSADLADFR